MSAGLVSIACLGGYGFVVTSYDIVFSVDPQSEGPEADLILCTSKAHMHGPTLLEMLKASKRVRVVMPKSACEYAHRLGIPYERMTTTDSGLRVEYFKQGTYGRVYAVPSAQPELDWTPLGGYPYLGYLMRFGETTVYHPGDSCWYDGLVDRLKPYRVTAALLPVKDPAQSAQLAEDIGAKWVVPIHDGADTDRFVDHMLGFRPALGFKVLDAGQSWTIPPEMP